MSIIVLQTSMTLLLNLCLKDGTMTDSIHKIKQFDSCGGVSAVLSAMVKHRNDVEMCHAGQLLVFAARNN